MKASPLSQVGALQAVTRIPEPLAWSVGLSEMEPLVRLLPIPGLALPPP